MTTYIEVTNCGAAYTEYSILYRNIRGYIKGCLTLNTFCKRLDDGKEVVITDKSKVVYKQGRKHISPVRIVFRKENTQFIGNIQHTKVSEVDSKKTLAAINHPLGDVYQYGWWGYVYDGKDWWKFPILDLGKIIKNTSK